jgi:hypothetical protein
MGKEGEGIMASAKEPQEQQRWRLDRASEKRVSHVDGYYDECLSIGQGKFGSDDEET